MANSITEIDGEWSLSQSISVINDNFNILSQLIANLQSGSDSDTATYMSNLEDKINDLKTSCDEYIARRLKALDERITALENA